MRLYQGQITRFDAVWPPSTTAFKVNSSSFLVDDEFPKGISPSLLYTLLCACCCTKLFASSLQYLDSVLIWRPRDCDSTQGLRESLLKVPISITNVRSIQQDFVAQNWGEEKQRRMGHYDGFTLKKKMRDSRTDEAPRPHSSTRLFLALVKSNGSRIAAVTIHES